MTFGKNDKQDLGASSRTTGASWAAVLAWAAFIFLMSANTGDSLDHGGGIVSALYQLLKEAQASVLGPGFDLVNPIAHFCEYAVFGALLANALRLNLPARTGARPVGGAFSPGAVVALAVALASLYGVTDELHQLFVPGRSSDPADWLVDTCGSLVGALLLCAFCRRARR